MEDNYNPASRWRAIGSDGKIWCESSSEREVRYRKRPGDIVQRLYEKVDTEWRTEEG